MWPPSRTLPIFRLSVGWWGRFSLRWARAKTVPQISIVGVTVPPTFARFVALYQMNVQVPLGVQTGNAVPVMIQMGDVSSNIAYIAVQ